MAVGILDYIQNTAEYIEKNIKQELSLEKISEEAELSKFYLNRIFSAITGQTLMAYVNSRKLVSSLNELLYTDMRIIDIACEYGFSFENSFIRSFKREFGITPDRFRRTKCELPTTALITSGILSAISEKSLLIKPTMIFKPAFHIIGDQCRVDESAYVATSYLTEFANDFYDNKMPLIGNKNEQVYYGHCLYVGSGYCDYTAGVETPENESPLEGLTAIRIPANTYWVFKYIGLHSPRKTTFLDFYHIIEASGKWFDIAGYQVPIYHFEKIDDDICTESYCELDLYFPAIEKT